MDDNLHICDVVSMYLETLYPNCSIEVSHNSKEAMETLIESNIKFDLIVCDYNMPRGNGDEVFRFVRQHYGTLPFLFFTSESLGRIQNDVAGFNFVACDYLHKPAQLETFEDIIKNLLSGKVDPEAELFFPVPIHHFFRFSQALCDVYLRLGEKKWVKVFHANEAYDEGRLNEFNNKGIQNLFIKSNDAVNLNCQLFHYPIFKGRGNFPLMGPREFFNFNAREVKVLLSNLRVKEAAITLATRQIGELVEEFEKIDLFKTLFEKQYYKSQYILDHSYLFCVLINLLLKQTGFNNKNLQHKLTYAALLHDMRLSSDELAFIQDVWPNDISALEEEQKKELEVHFKYLAQDLARSSKTPLGVEGLIECLNVGLNHPPKSLERDLSEFFNFTHKLVTYLFRYQFNMQAISKFIESEKNIKHGKLVREVLDVFTQVFPLGQNNQYLS